MAIYYRSELPLTNDNIVKITDELDVEYQKQVKKRAFKKNKFRLALEELLLRVRECYGEEKAVRVVFGKSFLHYYVDFSVAGERIEFAPSEIIERLSYDILVRLNVEPQYSYSQREGGRNHLYWGRLVEEKKLSFLASIIIALVLAIAAGILINMSSAELHSTLCDQMIAPIFKKLTLIFSAVATPLVFFAVIDGIINIGDVKAFGKIGSRLIKRMLSSYLVAALLLGIGGIIVYGIAEDVASGGEGGNAIGQVLQMVLDIIPNNLVTPFSEDNDLQVIVFAVFFGVTMLTMGNKLPRLTELIKEASDLVNKMMIICCKLLPFIIFFGVSNLIASSNAKQFLSIGKMILIYLSINAVFLTYMSLRAAFVSGVPFTKIFPCQIPTLLINITTSSQVAALPSNMKCCKESFGIDEKFVNFALPMGIVVYMPSGAIFLGLTAWGLCMIAGVPLGIGGIIRILLVGVVLAIAAPPIPGSAFVVLPVLFASCGVPAEMLPMGIIFGTIIGYLCPAFNGFNIQLELLSTAKRLKLIDEDKLKALKNKQ